MAAGSTRDFNSIHHNGEYARSTGAPDMYASSAFLLGTWERAVRDWIGRAGTIRSIRGFRMRRFNLVGDTTRVLGHVVSAELRDGAGVVVLELRSENSAGITVGPGQVEVLNRSSFGGPGSRNDYRLRTESPSRTDDDK